MYVCSMLICSYLTCNYISYIQLLCIGILITGSVAFTGIDLAEDNGDYPNGDSHRGVAGWTVFLGSAGIIYNCIILYSFFCHLNFVVQRHFKGYVYTVSNSCNYSYKQFYTHNNAK